MYIFVSRVHLPWKWLWLLNNSLKGVTTSNITSTFVWWHRLQVYNGEGETQIIIMNRVTSRCISQSPFWNYKYNSAMLGEISSTWLVLTVHWSFICAHLALNLPNNCWIIFANQYSFTLYMYNVYMDMYMRDIGTVELWDIYEKQERIYRKTKRILIMEYFK